MGIILALVIVKRLWNIFLSRSGGYRQITCAFIGISQNIYHISKYVAMVTVHAYLFSLLMAPNNTELNLFITAKMLQSQMKILCMYEIS